MNSIRRLIQWFGVVTPPLWTVAMALVFYSIIVGLYLFTLTFDAPHESETLRQVCIATVAAITGAYALYRGIAFHPAFNDQYHNWLALTPWRFPKPMPVGPMPIAAQDFVVLGMFELMLLNASLEDRVLVPAVFLFAVSAAWAFCLEATGCHRSTYAIGYALGAAVWVASWSHLLAGVVVVATYFWSAHCLRRSFDLFPWWSHTDKRRDMRRSISWMRKREKSMGEVGCGWAFDDLSPKRAERSPWLDRLLESGQLGWFLFAMQSHDDLALTWEAGGLFAIGFGGFRCIDKLVPYIQNHAPPISILGRVLTGRWVIPSYDIVFIPIVYYVLVAGISSLLVHPLVGVPMQYLAPCAITVFLVLINLGCPDLGKWRLTCKTRMTSWAYGLATTEFEQL